ncbi:hypothetical protein GGX14DRAFT_393986 [Mycena pura]|uniref:Uncharacterized protein n=1 Tax=Mycena pura TaxID=153505 RepID=A0AAD6VJU4_9AGAR|nr:hypothetical protein GGX14DRAFT_393986 [Mycena pura]
MSHAAIMVTLMVYVTFIGGTHSIGGLAVMSLLSDGINGTCGIGGLVVMHSLLPFLEKNTPKLIRLSSRDLTSSDVLRRGPLDVPRAYSFGYRDIPAQIVTPVTTPATRITAEGAPLQRSELLEKWQGPLEGGEEGEEGGTGVDGVFNQLEKQLAEEAEAEAETAGEMIEDSEDDMAEPSLLAAQAAAAKKRKKKSKLSLMAGHLYDFDLVKKALDNVVPQEVVQRVDVVRKSASGFIDIEALLYLRNKKSDGPAGAVSITLLLAAAAGASYTALNAPLPSVATPAHPALPGATNALALFRDTGYAQQISPAECDAFLTRFYSDAKAAFMIFDRNVQRSQTAIESGYTALLNGITDPTILNLITILAAALDVSPVVVGLLRHRSMELSIDFDGLFAKAIELIDAWKARRARN